MTAPRAESTRRSGLAAHAGLLVLLTALSVALWARVWITGSPSSTLICGCGDPGLNLWFIKWTEWSVIHFHNPFISNAVYAGQGGANNLDTDTLLAGFVGLPFTALFGAVFTFNLLSLLVPVANGWSMFVLARRLTGSYSGQVIASVLYGFSPYVVSNLMYGHFNIDVVAFPPLALWCLHDLLVGRRHSPRKIGVILGLLVVAQFFAGPELLAMCAVVGVFALAVLAVLARDLLRERWRALVTAGGLAAGLSLVLLAYPAWFLVLGPRHTSGLPWPHVPADGNLLQDLYNPGHFSAPAKGLWIMGYFGARGPTDSYLGIALLGFLLVSAPMWWRRRSGRCAFAVAAVAIVLSFGAGHEKWYHFWTPWRLFDRLPVVSEILPGRFALLTDVAVCILLAISVDSWWQARRLPARRRLVGAAATCVAAAALVPVGIAEAPPVTMHGLPTPAWFVGRAPGLAPGTRLLVLPDASSGATEAMTWQALDDFSFDMIGGYAMVPGPDGHTSDTIDRPTGATALLIDLSLDFAPQPVGSARQTAEVRTALQQWGVQVVVVTEEAQDPAYAAGFMTAVLGRAPLWQDGAWVWYGLGKAPSFGLRDGALFGCQVGAAAGPLAIPDCVLRRRGV